MNQMSKISVTVNGRRYPWPRVPAIAVCLDGCEPAYLDAAIDAGLMPALKRIKERGAVRLAHSVIPSFTNPNNLDCNRQSAGGARNLRELPLRAVDGRRGDDE